jgi:hypothetical protein
MDHAFLEHLLRATLEITHAERGLVVDQNLNVLQTHNIDPEEIESEKFKAFAIANLREAMAMDDPVIANDVITDVSEAPTTNTNFANLRIAVALPISTIGAVYIDRRIRHGVIPRNVIDRIMRLVAHITKTQVTINNSADLVKLYEELETHS